MGSRRFFQAMHAWRIHFFYEHVVERADLGSCVQPLHALLGFQVRLIKQTQLLIICFVDSIFIQGYRSNGSYFLSPIGPRNQSCLDVVHKHGGINGFGLRWRQDAEQVAQVIAFAVFVICAKDAHHAGVI